MPNRRICQNPIGRRRKTNPTNICALAFNVTRKKPSHVADSRIILPYSPVSLCCDAIPHPASPYNMKGLNHIDNHEANSEEAPKKQARVESRAGTSKSCVVSGFLAAFLHNSLTVCVTSRETTAEGKRFSGGKKQA